MKTNLQNRRQILLRELARVNREIVWTQKDLVRIESRIAFLKPAKAKAA